MRLTYPPNVKIIRVPCTGKVDLMHIMHSFEKGADGVCVIGCMEGDCRFIRGNLEAKKRVHQARDYLEALGVGGDRVAMYNLSSSEGPKFARIAKEMCDRIYSLGPSPIKQALKSKAA
jgi:coenzyme F420-reducing hydrogenase delta subunit